MTMGLLHALVERWQEDEEDASRTVRPVARQMMWFVSVHNLSSLQMRLEGSLASVCRTPRSTQPHSHREQRE